MSNGIVTELPIESGPLGFTTPVTPGFRAIPFDPRSRQKARESRQAARIQRVSERQSFVTVRRKLIGDRKQLNPTLKALRRERGILAEQRKLSGVQSQISTLRSDIETLEGFPSEFGNLQDASSVGVAEEEKPTTQSNIGLFIIIGLILAVFAGRK